MKSQDETKPVTEGTETVPQRTAKDSVFCDLFQDPENLLELYRCLHPEDTTATAEDLGNVTLRNILVEDQYNDSRIHRRVNPATHTAALYVAGFI